MTTSTSYSQRLTQLLLGVLALGVWLLLLRPYMPSAFAESKSSKTPDSATFDTLTVQEIKVVDPDGKMRLIIANSARFPGAITGGTTQTRSIDNPAGLLFLDAKGNETGGLAIAKLRDKDVTNFAFDYTYQLTDGIRMSKQESTDGARWRAGFDIFDRRPFTGKLESSGMPAFESV